MNQDQKYQVLLIYCESLILVIDIQISAESIQEAIAENGFDIDESGDLDIQEFTKMMEWLGLYKKVISD